MMLSREQKRSRGSFWPDAGGSLTVEALLILPAILLLLTLFLRWGLMLREDFRKIEEEKAVAAMSKSAPPARRIRDADTIIDLGRSIKESLPVWFQTESER